jgi:hypothetical protein
MGQAIKSQAAIATITANIATVRASQMNQRRILASDFDSGPSALRGSLCGGSLRPDVGGD